MKTLSPAQMMSFSSISSSKKNEHFPVFIEMTQVRWLKHRPPECLLTPTAQDAPVCVKESRGHLFLSSERHLTKMY